MAGTKLIAVLGAKPYKETAYALNGVKSTKSCYATAALLDVLPLKGPVEARVVLTDKARNAHGSGVKEALEMRGASFVDVPIPSGRSVSEIWEIFRTLVAQVDDGDRVVLDVTHGFRSIPMLMIGSVLYVKELRRVQILGLYYGAYEARDEITQTAPFFDLTPLIQMVDWAHAARIFSRYGHAFEVGAMLREIQDRAHRDPVKCAKPFRLKTLGEGLVALSRALAEGIPLEAGRVAMHLRQLDPVTLGQEMGCFAPAAEAIVPSLLMAFDEFALPGPGAKRDWKKALILDSDELQREARVVDWYLDRWQLTPALQLMREWMVNRVMLALGMERLWLDYANGRRAAERKLTVLARLVEKQEEPLSKENKVLGGWWLQVAARRNELAHGGFSHREVAFSGEQRLRKTWEEMKARVGNDGLWKARRPSGEMGKVLVSCLGLSPGLLYSAIRRLGPDRLVVVTSKEAKDSIAEILYRAHAAHLPYHVWIFSDPFCGFGEVEKIVEGIRPIVLRADRIVVNLTGGTTVMQLAVQRVSEMARELDANVREIALVDRRTPEEQRRDPYVLGELVELTPTV